MPPKKKGNKKAQDNWEDDLGESIVPQDAAPAEPAAESAEPAEEEAPVSGLMAALAKRGKKGKKGKKGAQEDWEAELGESPAAGDDPFAGKAPEEANFDEDDVFAGNFKPKKEPKEEKVEAKAPVVDDAPRVKTKAEKEKEKKEKEKQRKKEMVCWKDIQSGLVLTLCRPRRRRPTHPQRPKPRSPRRPRLPLHQRPHPRPLLLQLPLGRRERRSRPL